MVVPVHQSLLWRGYGHFLVEVVIQIRGIYGKRDRSQSNRLIEHLHLAGIGIYCTFDLRRHGKAHDAMVFHRQVGLLGDPDRLFHLAGLV